MEMINMTENKMTTQEKVEMFFNNTNKRANYNYKELRQELVGNFLESGYFESTTQELIFKRMLKEIHEVMKEQNSLSVSSSTYYANSQLIDGIKALFPESWKMVRYFKYYAGTSSLNDATTTDILNVVISISKQDRSKFDKLNLMEETIDISKEIEERSETQVA
jgi:hypothetical protein